MQRIIRDGHGKVRIADAAQSVGDYIREIRGFLASVQVHAGPTAKAREWLLDNHYLVDREIHRIPKDLPRSFVRKLPRIDESGAAPRTRVGDLAFHLCVQTSLSLDENSIREFLTAFQEVEVLSIAELWAFPAMLRATVVEFLIVAIDKVCAGQQARMPIELPDVDIPGLEADEIVVRAIRGLQTLAVISWKDCFEALSRVDRILHEDPSAVYPRMDFQTRDSYRKAVEAIAQRLGLSEVDVARLALEHSTRTVDPRKKHIGYWLIDAGRHSIEQDHGHQLSIPERIHRSIVEHPTPWYFVGLGLMTLVFWSIPGWYLLSMDVGAYAWILVLILTLIPATALATTFLQWMLSQFFEPRILPKLELETLDPKVGHTLVVIPTLIGTQDSVRELLHKIEIHYLSNPLPGFHFALLTDFHDAERQDMPEDAELVELLAAGIEDLNHRHGNENNRPFHALHRERLWNASEGRFIGWERKRGKLEELNRLLRGATNTSFVLVLGDRQWLRSVKFVITLDSDTQLPRGMAQRMVGILAHPLNVAQRDPDTGRTTQGYTIIQPRIEVSPSSIQRSRFTHWYTGDSGFDIYTTAVSDTYQDLFGEGSYIGKGIYEVDAFQASVDRRIPDNRIVSHDLLEGILGRVALATDVVLHEEYPSNYLAYARRLHRWVRGDWQILPWLMPRIPTRDGEPVPNRLSAIARWKILDNIRRSLLIPTTLVLLLAGWLLLPGSPWVWTLFAILAPSGHIVTGLIQELVRARFRSISRPWKWRPARSLQASLARWILACVFLVHESIVICDAIVRSLYRMSVSRAHLLQWTTAKQTEIALARQLPRTASWMTMFPSVVVTIVIGLAVALLSPGAMPAAAPLLALWIMAPEIALWLRRMARDRREELTQEDKRELRHLARKTWLFYETFVGPADQWLPPDHYQEDPGMVVAHRTSPTNIAMLLLSIQTAYDLGFIGVSEFVTRIRETLDGLQRLERYRGHPFNWYGTQRLEPLTPRYVSSVDSGNLAGALIVLQQSCQQMIEAPILRAEQWQGLADTLELILEDVERLEKSAARIDLRGFKEEANRQLEEVLHARAHPDAWRSTTRTLSEGHPETLHRILTTSLEHDTAGVDLSVLRDLRDWLDRLDLQLTGMSRDLADLLPHAPDPPDIERLICPRIDAGLANVAAACTTTLADATDRQHGRSDPELSKTARRAQVLVSELETLGLRAATELHEMDFSLLYDRQRKLLHIGYDVDAGRLDPHYYDLLASEARLASYIAIVKGDVPQEHWFALGRPLTRIGHRTALLSWSATMFEYLMPDLLMRSTEHTLLHQSSVVAVERQISYGKDMGMPWGISESGYYSFDASDNYQYRAFGVPGLGFQRGLEDDRVVSPYSSMLALELRPKAVIDNLVTLVGAGMMGQYGLYEAIDYTEPRIPSGRSGGIVRSYMAHHQGMTLVAIGNHLCHQSMTTRFHSHPLVQTDEMLLNEQVPYPQEVEAPKTDSGEVPYHMEAAPGVVRTWAPRMHEDTQSSHLLSNRRLTSIFTNTGSGGLIWNGLEITRWTAAAPSDSGNWLYARDEETGDLWSAGRAPTGHWPEDAHLSFLTHAVELTRRDHGILLHLEIIVSPQDDVEVRRVTITNETDRRRRISLTSACEPVLEQAEDDARHPAYSRLFLEAEHLTRPCGVCFRRREANSDMPTAVVFHGVVGGESSEDRIHLESDRRRFVGRLGRWGQPAGLDEMEVAAEESHRSVLDPIMAVQAVVDLDARRTIELAFITAVSGSRSKTLELARSHASVQTLHWMFQDAEREMMKHLEFLGIEPATIEVTERLLDAMFWPRSVLRAPDDRSGMALARQPRLWGQGVSGDYPILLLCVHDAESALIADTLAAHRYWNSCGIKVELVIINEMSSSYRDSIGDRIRRLLAQTRSALLLGQRGGLFLLPGDRLPALDRQNLFAAASAVLDTREGDLSAQVDRVDDRLIALPALPATLPPSSIEPSEDEPVDLLFFNGLGGFTHDGSEYELRHSKAVRTPMPWCNVIANAGFGTVLSESGLGYSWANNSSEFRLTPWYNDPVQDPPGEVVYLRDEETAEVWSATPLPSSLDEDFSVKHGAGCTEYSHSSHGLSHKMRVFVPADASTKIIDMHLVNRLDRPRRLTITYFVEWVLGTVREQTRRFIRTDYAHDDGTLLAQCSWNPDFAGRHAFVTTDHEVHGFTCDRREFLGVDEDRSRPEGLKRWGLSSEIRQGEDACAAIQIHIDMDPGAQVDMHFVLGEAATREAALALARRMRDPRTIRSALLELQEQWEDRLGRLTVKTPDPALDLMINRWLPYQTISSRLFGRTGFYQSSGAFGFRDQLQDVMTLLQTQPSMARTHILDCAAHQFEEGDVMHWWHPPSDKGVRTRCSDDLLWLPYVTAHYVHGTGDDSILSEVVPFLRAEPLGPDMHVHYGQFDKGRSASVLEHCLAAIRCGFTQGEHGLPLMGDSDWNDGMDRVGSQGRGESVWLGWFLHATVTDFAQLLPVRDREEWTGRCATLREALELHGWDGAWYRRAFHDDESIVGSARSVECQIDSISQSWATLSGAARKDRAIQALRSAYDHLVDEQQRIIYLLTPPFDRTRHDPGYIRAYPPGVRENGGQYTHAAAWLAWAFADAGDGDTAGNMLEMLNPIQHARDRSAVESYCVEPYALAADIYSVPPHDGRGGWTWYTGAASWTWRLGVEAVLGLRLEGGDLVIDPCLPSSWPGYRATLRHPDGEFDVVVENPDHVCRGRISVRLDGRLHATNRLPREAGRHEVHVTMHAIGDGSTTSPREQSEGAATRPD